MIVHKIDFSYFHAKLHFVKLVPNKFIDILKLI